MPQYYMNGPNPSAGSPFGKLVLPGNFRQQWHQGGPVISSLIVEICVTVWLVELVSSFLFPNFYAALIGYGAFGPWLFGTRPWISVTSMFLHSINPLHVLFNMITLWFIGPSLERLMGHIPFAILYLVSGIGGDTGLMLAARFDPASSLGVLSLGASGAIFGLFAALVLVYKRSGIDIRAFVILLAINFAFPLITPGIAWQAHVGGFIAGGLLTMLLMWRAPFLKKLSLYQRAWILGLCLLVLEIIIMYWCFSFLHW